MDIQTAGWRFATLPHTAASTGRDCASSRSESVLAEGPGEGGEPPADGPEGDRPHRLGPSSPPPWGPRGRGRGGRLGWGHIRILYKAPTDNTKPRQTIQVPKTLYSGYYYMFTHIYLIYIYILIYILYIPITYIYIIYAATYVYIIYIIYIIYVIALMFYCRGASQSLMICNT